MSSRRGAREAELLLPLTAGILSVATFAVVPAGWAVLLHLPVLLALGAVLPGRPWRTGAVAALPTVVAALVRTAGESMGTFGVLLAGSPLFVALTVLAVKGGAVLVAPSTEPKAAGRRRPFATQAGRGRFLVIVAVLLLLGVSLSRNLGAGEADRAAARRAEDIRRALRGQSVDSLRQASLHPGFIGGPPGVPGGPYRSLRPGLDRFTATIEVRAMAQHRCIHVEVDAAGTVTTRVVKDRCD